MSSKVWIRLHPASRVHWLAALSISIACADDGAAVGTETDTEAEESSSSSAETVTVTATTSATTTADTSTSADTSSSEESSTMASSSSESGDPCGNGTLDDGEVCDGDQLGDATCESEGFGGGTLACAADCSALDTAMCDTCGNDVVDGSDDCDGTDLGAEDCLSLGFDAGEVACAADCTYDTTACVMFSCGDGVVNDPREECDGADVPTDCADQGFGAGTVTCTAGCTLDTSGCCGDDEVGGTETCDGTDLAGQTCADQAGFDDGVLSCNADCGGFDVSSCTSCGDGEIEGNEECEGADLAGNDCTSIGAGFVAGTLSCSASCGFDTSNCNFCGNDNLNMGEQCDGTALGGMDCLDIGFTGGAIGCFEDCTYDTELCTNFPLPGIGDVVITEIMRNPTSIVDASGEWFEITNVGAETYQLLGCTVQDDGGDDFPIDVDLTIAPGEYLTFANSAMPGFTPDFVYAGMNLANADDELELICNAVSVDRVAYDDPGMMGHLFPSLAAHAMQLEPTLTDAVSNDSGTNWCDALTPYFMTDTGTPGTVNDTCSPAEFDIDFCRLQAPVTIDGDSGSDVDVFGRVYIAGQTDLSGVNDTSPNIVGYVGYGPDGSDPSVSAMWTWTLGTPNAGYGPASPAYEMNNDEYVATMTLPAEGTYDFAYRFSGDGGDTFTYCDGGNAGSSDGYAAVDAGQMTTASVGGSQSVLYFSEYHEGPGALNYRGLEIHNPSDEAVDLTGCTVVQYFNGSVMPGTSFNLTGNVAAGDVYSLCHSAFNAVVVGGCDQVGGLQFSGDDAVELVCGGTTNDVIGEIGDDPGTAWAANGVTTLDADIRRDCAFQDGDPVGNDAFDPSVEWDFFALDGVLNYNVDDFGQHVCP
ncbi:MAG TPA: lamin tail domain-containing protein [Nannocystaceae bacterium]|nr:lamin tail domain-containing protein [Nannocystaceae bacterium]